jgi:threonine dehydrogenase-like Zn-dependent dehydrogenase
VAAEVIACGSGETYPITVDASGTSAGLAYALAVLSAGGICTGVGFYLRRSTPVALWKMYMKCAALQVGVSHPRAHLPVILPLIECGRFDPTPLNTPIGTGAAWRRKIMNTLSLEPPYVYFCNHIASDGTPRCGARIASVVHFKVN